MHRRRCASVVRVGIGRRRIHVSERTTNTSFIDHHPHQHRHQALMISCTLSYRVDAFSGHREGGERAAISAESAAGFLFKASQSPPLPCTHGTCTTAMRSFTRSLVSHRVRMLPYKSINHNIQICTIYYSVLYTNMYILLPRRLLVWRSHKSKRMCVPSLYATMRLHKLQPFCLVRLWGGGGCSKGLGFHVVASLNFLFTHTTPNCTPNTRLPNIQHAPQQHVQVLWS